VKAGYGGGPIVKDNISGKIINLLLDSFRMEQITVDEFTAARLTIEKAILNHAIDNAEDQDIEDLQKCLARAKGLIANKQLATEVNFEFHSLLARASKNKVFVILEQAINAIHHKLRDRRATDFETSKTAVQEHEKLLDALIRKERDKAIQLLEKHVLTVRKSY